jgi:parallel beta-helix repeat protein
LQLEALEERWCPSTLTVGSGEQYATINAAYPHANPGDTIQVYPGTYTEQVKIDKANINLTGVTVNGSTPTIQSPASVTTVTVGGFNMGGALIDITATGDTVNNFTINGATNTDGNLYSGVRVRSSGSATISSNIITGLTTSSSQLFGIGVQVGTNRGGGSGATATVTSNIIKNYAGAGILVDGRASATITSNVITGRGSGNNGEAEYGVQVGRGAIGDVESNTISGNSNGNNSGGIYFYQDGGVNSIAKSNAVSGNDVGIWLDTSSATNQGSIQIVSNSVTGNTGFAGILDQSSNGVSIQSNSVTNNNTFNGIALAFASNVQITSNTVTNNASDGIYDFMGTSNVITSNTSSNNNGNGVYLQGAVGDTISANSLKNNTGAGVLLTNGSTTTNNTITNNKFANNTGGDIVQD